MAKLQFVLYGPATEPAAHFAARVLERVAPRLRALDPPRLKVTLTTATPPRLSLIPFRRARLAVVSVWESAPERLPSYVRTVSAVAPGVAVYRVTESCPRRYERTWADGLPTPGVALVTLLRRRPDLPRDRFLTAWLEEHGQHALAVHPLWSYGRNVVEEALTPGAPPWDGIVEEQFRHRRDLLGPLRLFGGLRAAVPNAIATYRHLQTFLDLVALETYLADEIHLRTT